MYGLKRYLLLEPAHGFLLANAVLVSDASLLALLIGNAEAWSAHNLQTGRHQKQLNRSTHEVTDQMTTPPVLMNKVMSTGKQASST